MISPTRQSMVRDALTALAPIRVRKLFGTEAFFHGERMFAVLGVGALVLRLPEPLRTQTLANGVARPFLSERLAHMDGWVEVPYGAEVARLMTLAQAAHVAAGRGRAPAKRRFRRAARQRTPRMP
jgi:TfoX/Sxy family transcriptional regulator of competence genes